MMNHDSFEVTDFRSNFYYNNFVPLVQKTERPRDHLQDITTYFTNICVLYDFCSFDDSILYLLSPLCQSLFSLSGPCLNSVSLPMREYKQFVDNPPLLCKMAHGYTRAGSRSPVKLDILHFRRVHGMHVLRGPTLKRRQCPLRKCTGLCDFAEAL